MDMTTIQVGKDVADLLKKNGLTYDKTLREIIIPTEPVKVLTFKKTTPLLETESEEKRIPFNGEIARVTMHFPPGCCALVDVRLLYVEDGKEYFVAPSMEDAFIALDAATPEFRVKYPVKAGQILRVEWYNYDDTNSHTISVIATIEPRVI